MASWNYLLATALAVGVAVLTGHTVHAQLWEGNPCMLDGRGKGTCKLLTECPSQLELVTGSRRFQPQICSFKGSDAVVCCPRVGRLVASGPWGGRRTTTPTTTTTTEATTLPPPQTSRPGPTGGGEKSERACREYSKEVAIYPIGLIFGGKETAPGEFPHMALLGYRPPSQNEVTWNCGGALISHRFVVTAAHCFDSQQLKAPVVVRLGEHNLAIDNDDAIDYRVESWVRHPSYRIRSYYHDLALIKLDRHVQFTESIQPACIWIQPEEPADKLIVTGWGSTTQEGDGPQSNVLLQGNGTLSKVSPDVCSGFYKSARAQLRNGAQDGILCAMDPTGTVDTCKGDSGGPIQVKTDISGVKYYVVGVVSGGSVFCGNRVPSIYTSLNTYIGWIESKVWPDADS